MARKQRGLASPNDDNERELDSILRSCYCSILPYSLVELTCYLSCYLGIERLGEYLLRDGYFFRELTANSDNFDSLRSLKIEC